jgi:hypothetical protein
MMGQGCALTLVLWGFGLEGSWGVEVLKILVKS